MTRVGVYDMGDAGCPCRLRGIALITSGWWGAGARLDAPGKPLTTVWRVRARMEIEGKGRSGSRARRCLYARADRERCGFGRSVPRRTRRRSESPAKLRLQPCAGIAASATG